MKYKIIFILISSFTVQVLQAQETRTISLKEAINLSLKNSAFLKLNQAKILEASNQIKEAQERKLPEATASASYLYLPIKPVVSLKLGSGTGAPSPTIHQAMYTSISGSIPLYTANKINYGIESAQFLEKAIKLDAENDKASIIMNVTQACINLYKTVQVIELVKENLSSSQKRVNDLKNLEKNGLLARNDLLKAELQSSNIELTLLDATSNYKLACVHLNLMMGLPEQTIIVPDKNGLTLPTTIKTLDEYEQNALANRKDKAALAERKKATSLGVNLANAEKYPTAVLTTGYVAADVPKFLTLYNAINIGIGVKYNIASLWKTKTKIAEAKLKVDEVTIHEKILDDEIRLQINQAYEQYLLSVKKIEVYEKAVIQASENFRITKNKNANALATTTELLDADVALLQAKLSVANAKADSFLDYTKILQVSGLL